LGFLNRVPSSLERLERQLKMYITDTQRKHLIQACHTAIQEEEAFIDAYSNVRDGSEKEPVKHSKKWIKRWKKLIIYLETKTKGYL
jgi:hypothetical protein